MLVLLLAVVAQGVAIPETSFAAPAAQAVPDEAPDESSATLAAQRGNKPVRVLSQTDEFTEVRANPNGSMTMTQHLRPVRVKQSGEWIPVDMTLVRRADGTVAPKATPVDVVLSGGGAKAPIVKVAKDGTEVGLGWPEALPEPSLDGPTATYSEVLPGVDLKVTADVYGFNQVLVVKTPEAAGNPKLRTVSFGSYTKAAKVRAVAGLQAGDSGPVFKGTASRMWDSSGDATPADRLTGNALGTHAEAMSVQVSDAAIAITPDQRFLAAPETRYPVYLDPSYRCTNCGKAHHVVVQDYGTWRDAKNFDRTDGDLGDLKAGYVCDNGKCFISRTYLRMNTTGLAGKYIQNAYLHLETIQAYYCGGNATATELYASTWFDQDTTWNQQPTWRPFQSGGQSCAGSGLDLNAKGAVEEAAAGSWSEMPLGLKGQNEGNDTAWRRFQLDPYLVVDYNSWPLPPSDLGVEGWGPNAGDALPCKLGADRPFAGTRSPRLRARFRDPDPGMMNGGFTVFDGPFNSSGHFVQSNVDNIPPGTFAEVRIPLPADGIYNWNAWSGDHELSSYSPFCEFQIDTVAPGQPLVTSAQYPRDRESGGVGKNGTFEFSAPAGTTDIAYYLYAFAGQGDDPQIRANPRALNGSAIVSWTPMVSGPQTLSVRSVDRAGNRSPIFRYVIDVADYQVGVSGKVARWSLDDSTSDVSQAKSLTYTGPPPPGGFFGDGHDGRAVLMGAANAEYYQARDALVRTDSSFSVAAWARLDADDRYATVVSQDGTRASGMKLQYDDLADRWSLTFNAADADNTTAAVRVLSAQPPAVGAWTHLVGVYDATAKKARLYVDNTPTESDVPTTPWNATSPFVVGAAKVDGKRDQHFTGAVDTVRVYSKALTVAEVTTLFNGSGNAGPVAEYLFEDSLVNSGANNDLSVTGQGYGSGFAGKAAKFDQANTARPVTTGPVITTTDGFSVAAWVKLNDLNGQYTVATQDGSQTSGFILRYAADAHQWVFGLAKADVTGSDQMQWVGSATTPITTEWTHVVGVHDTNTHTISIYINGVRANRRDVTTAFDARGPFVIGAGKSGVRNNFMNGLIDEVNVYDGALTDAEAGALANAPFERSRFALDETSGTTAANGIPGGAPGTLYGNGLTWGQSNGKPAANFTGPPFGTPANVPGAAPSGRWNMENDLTDASGHGLTLQHWQGSAQTAPSYVAGFPGWGVALNGSQNWLATPGPVVNVGQSFSVSARAKVDKADASYTVFSQDGKTNSSFVLQYSKADNAWVFGVAANDTGAPLVKAKSALPPQIGFWAQLMGVYDKEAGKARLYVNGYLESEVTVGPMTATSGSFALGRAKQNGQPADYLPGAVDQVHVYDRVLGASDAYALWDTMRDITAPLDPMFRTDRSFTVAAWVRPDMDTDTRLALSIGPNRQFAPLSIGYFPDYKRWRVVVATTDTTDPAPKSILSDNEASTYLDENGWAHLAVTYDTVSRKIRFFVNGIAQSTVETDATRFVKVDPANPNPPGNFGGANTVITDAGRNLVIGRTTWWGMAVSGWKGAIRDVRTYTGVLPESCTQDAPDCLQKLVGK